MFYTQDMRKLGVLFIADTSLSAFVSITQVALNFNLNYTDRQPDSGDCKPRINLQPILLSSSFRWNVTDCSTSTLQTIRQTLATSLNLLLSIESSF